MSAVARVVELWREAWREPMPDAQLSWTRAILGLHALWMLLSRPDMPSLMRWPAAFFASVEPATMLRFGIGFLPEAGEHVLWVVLHVALVAAVFGVLPRSASFIAGVLLYHFAPFEELIAGNPHTFFGGLTIPALGLLVISFARETTWPVVLIRLLFAANYFNAFLAKLRFTHGAWFTADNLRQWCIVNWHFTRPPLAAAIANSPLACWSIAVGTFFLESLFPLAAISKRARWILVPAATAGHVGIVLTLGIWFPSLPLLLLYVDVPRRLIDRSAGAPVTQN
jgi:hypothetical protein